MLYSNSTPRKIPPWLWSDSGRNIHVPGVTDADTDEFQSRGPRWLPAGRVSAHPTRVGRPSFVHVPCAVRIQQPTAVLLVCNPSPRKAGIPNCTVDGPQSPVHTFGLVPCQSRLVATKCCCYCCSCYDDCPGRDQGKFPRQSVEGDWSPKALSWPLNRRRKQQRWWWYCNRLWKVCARVTTCIWWGCRLQLCPTFLQWYLACFPAIHARS